MYSVNIKSLLLNQSQINCLNATGYSFQRGSNILLCETCARTITQSPPNIHAQAYYNRLDTPPIPQELLSLTNVEIDFLCRVRPFMKIRRAPCYIGQDRLEGSVIHFTKDIPEVHPIIPALLLSPQMLYSLLKIF